MTINYAERDKRITLGQIKGNIVTNTVALFGHYKAAGQTKSLTDVAAEVLELHRHVESMDLETIYNPPKTTENTKGKAYFLAAIGKINSVGKLYAFRSKFIEELNSLPEEDKVDVRAAFSTRLGELG